MAHRPRRLVLGAVAGYVLLGALLIAPHGFNPEWFVHFGAEDSTVVAHGRAVLGADVLTPHRQGADGQVFWLLARDPLLLHPDVVLAHADRPAYRAQRALYPALVAPSRLAGERAMVWGLVLVNLAAVALGSWLALRLAAAVRAPPRAALAFAASPAVVAGFVLDASDTLAVACTVGGILAWVERRHRGAALWFVAAALTKEITLLAPAALCLQALVADRDARRALGVGGPALLATAAWAVYVRVRLDWPGAEIQEVTGPFAGYVDAFRRGWEPNGDWGNAAVAGALLVFAAVVVLAWARNPRDPLLTAAVPFCILVPFLSAQVLDLALNSVRAVGPAITLAALAAYARWNPIEAAR